ncbi:MAG: acyl-CoA dehydratase activase [Chloroflexota bacterium]
MIVAGIDVGGTNVQVVVVEDGKILAKADGPAGIKKADAAERIYDEALKQANLKRKDVACVVSTGGASDRVRFRDGAISDAAADARGVHQLIPSARTVLDVGGEEARAIKIDADGRVLDFAMNEKCAAGTGTFVDTMARALEITVEEMGQLSLNSTTSISINAQCAVFGESEVVSLIHQKVPKQDIAHAVHDAIAGRIGSLARIVGVEEDVVLIGGVGRNLGLLGCLKEDLGVDVKVPEDPDYVGALGAAAAGVAEGMTEDSAVEKQAISEGEGYK